MNNLDSVDTESLNLISKLRRWYDLDDDDEEFELLKLELYEYGLSDEDINEPTIYTLSILIEVFSNNDLRAITKKRLG